MSHPIPRDARATLPTLTLSMASRHYGVSRQTIHRWCRVLGIVCRKTTSGDYAEFAKLARRHYAQHEMPESKTCTACGEEKPASGFRLDRTVRGTPYLYGRCKVCLAAGLPSLQPRKRAEPLPAHDPWARDLYLQALRAFDLARSKVTEEDYA